ncbi:MAG TPA: response regulator [Verrucomicrobiae bacterium]|nr:response regulator [Verrucomicrobiae bacterium]
MLAVEDEESDALLLELAMKEAGAPNKLIVVRDGQELVDYLSRRPPFGDRRRFPDPGVLLLDLKMPRMDGFQVLTWLSEHAEFAHIPVIIFSASMCQADIRRALQMGASDYLEKPSQFATLVEMCRKLTHRWLINPRPAVPSPVVTHLAHRRTNQRFFEF